MSRYLILGDQMIRVRKPYGFFRFLFDLFMTGLTGGLWLLWLLFKYLRNGSI